MSLAVWLSLFGFIWESSNGKRGGKGVLLDTDSMKRMRLMRCSKATLLAGVSAIAIAIAQPISAQAGDLPRKAPVYKAPSALVPVNRWTFWIEGGPQAVAGGDPSIAGLTPAFVPAKRTWGWDVAGAVDYRIDATWHVSADFRYRVNKSRTTTSTQGALTSFSPFPGFPLTIPYVGGNSANRKELNWVADFMVGRDLGIGSGTSQLKAGLRVARISGTTNGAAILSSTAGYQIRESYQQTSKFTGFGPRLAVEGDVPLYDRWSLDYMAGAAVLFGKRDINQTGTSAEFSAAGAPVAFAYVCLSGCVATLSTSSNKAIFNTDAMLGLAYAITPNAKISLNYHIDYYADAMRTVDSAGNVSDADRLYHGASLRLTLNY